MELPSMSGDLNGRAVMAAREERLAPLLKYPGGKEKELKYILPSLPQGCWDYYEPFVGGGAVYFAVRAGRSFINDKSTELASLYRMVQEQNPEFLRKAWEMEHCWETLSRVTADCIEELTGIYTDCRKKSAKTLGRLADEFLKRRGTEFEAVMKTCFFAEDRGICASAGKKPEGQDGAHEKAGEAAGKIKRGGPGFEPGGSGKKRRLHPFSFSL